MKLLTQAIKKKLPPLRSQEKEADPMVYVKFFDPCSQWTWFVTEGSEDGIDFTFFGWVVGLDQELGYFSLNELKRVKNRFGLGIERDLYFEPKRLSEVKKLYAKA